MANEDFMREEILFQKEIFERFYNTHVIEQVELEKFDEIWLSGSGDSHCAALFGSALANILGYTARALTPMNASYFMNHQRNIALLLLAISVSGESVRVLEVVKKVNKNYPNHKTIGLTDNQQSNLAKLSDQTIILQASPREILESSDNKEGIAKVYTGYHHGIAQTKTFFANILYLITLIYPQFYTNALFSKGSISSWLIQAEQLAKANPILYPQKTIFVGSGMEESLAQFGQYKWFEYTFPGLHQDIEEYAHTHYFITDQQTTVVFFAPSGPLLDRALELINGALGNLIKPQIVLITNEQVQSEYKITVLNILDSNEQQQGIDKEIGYYIKALILLEWYTHYTARENGFDTNQFRGGAEGEKYVRGSYQTIRKSKIHD